MNGWVSSKINGLIHYHVCDVFQPPVSLKVISIWKELYEFVRVGLAKSVLIRPGDFRDSQNENLAKRCLIPVRFTRYGGEITAV